MHRAEERQLKTAAAITRAISGGFLRFWTLLVRVAYFSYLDHEWKITSLIILWGKCRPGYKARTQFDRTAISTYSGMHQDNYPGGCRQPTVAFAEVEMKRTATCQGSDFQYRRLPWLFAFLCKWKCFPRAVAMFMHLLSHRGLCCMQLQGLVSRPESDAIGFCEYFSAVFFIISLVFTGS